jgi:hypothetical protein
MGMSAAAGPVAVLEQFECFDHGNRIRVDDGEWRSWLHALLANLRGYANTGRRVAALLAQGKRLSRTQRIGQQPAHDPEQPRSTRVERLAGRMTEMEARVGPKARWSAYEGREHVGAGHLRTCARD